MEPLAEIIKQFSLTQTAILLIFVIVIWMKVNSLTDSFAAHRHEFEQRIIEMKREFKERTDHVEQEVLNVRENVHALYGRVIEQLVELIGSLKK